MRKSLFINSAILVGVLTTCIVQPAFAQEPSTVEPTAETASTSLEVVPQELLAEPAAVSDSGSAFESESDDGGTVSVAHDPNQGIEIVSAEGVSVGITIPEADSADAAQVADNGLIVFEGTEGFVTSVVPSDGGAQFLTSITSADAPETYSYNLDLPDGATVASDPETTALIVRDVAGELLFLVAPAWALDSNGVAVPTHFEFSNGTVTQVVEHHGEGAAYPIVADPNVSGKLIKSYKWVGSKQGYTISVAVTPAMGWASIATANKDGWAELKKHVKKHSRASTYTLLSIPSMKQQWSCHALGKAAIGIGGWLGIDKKPTWDLETWRPALSGSKAAATMIDKRCNW